MIGWVKWKIRQNQEGLKRQTQQELQMWKDRAVRRTRSPIRGPAQTKRSHAAPRYRQDEAQAGPNAAACIGRAGVGLGWRGISAATTEKSERSWIQRKGGG